MAATGGGKIRSRRYHVVSKPYAKSKQPSGLISRVTDTVKSIVPSWLQNYFKNGEAPEGEAGGGGGEGEGGGEAADVTENCLLPTPNGGREGPRSLDGCHSPEPSTSHTEPSSSRASLNFQDYVLSRPPLSHSHLHFSPLESSSPGLGSASCLFSQPSTSSAPGPFSTGFSLVKEIKDNLSQHEDDNISTTSGFSSRASDKDVPTSKAASVPQLWSPDADRSISVPQPSQSSLKRPAFNLSVFGTSANSTLNSTVLNSSQLGDSPFYPGKTSYGGAAAVRSAHTRPGTPYQAPLRRQIKAKPAGAHPCGVTSATARRILQSLERMSSPLADAKRIPAATLPCAMSMEGGNLDGSHLPSKKKRRDSSHPPVQKLVVPAAISISASANRAVSFRPSLTPGGPGRNLDHLPRDKPARQSPLLPDRSPGGPSQSTIGSSGATYPMSSTPAPSSSGGGKMKTERKTARPSSKRTEDDKVAELPDLRPISLPISTSALPTFSFSSPLPPATASSVTSVKEIAMNKATPVSPSCVIPFTFSSPIVKATPASPPNFSPTAGFTFSAPVTKIGPSMSNGKLATPIASPVKISTNASTEDFDGPFKPAKTLKQGSVLDLLKTPGFASTTVQKSPETSTQSSAHSSSSSTASSTSSSTALSDFFKAPAGWSCNVCLVQNKPSDTKCVCCMAPQPAATTKDNKTTAPALSEAKSSTNSTSVGSPFFKSAPTWECDTCLVFNKPEAVKCVACETAKPGTGLKASSSLPSAFSAVKRAASPAPVASTTPLAGFEDKRKKPDGASDGDISVVQNKAADTDPKPGASAGAPTAASSTLSFSFGDKLKKPENSWDCDVCLLQNKAANVKCVACQAAKPGTPAELQGSSTTSASGGFTFGTTNSTSESTSGGFKFGVASSESSSSSLGGFKFGIPFGNGSSEAPAKDGNTSLGFKFSASSEGLKFGIAPGDDKKPEQLAAPAGFKFGSSGEISLAAGSSSTESSSSSKTSFSFGLSKPEDKTLEDAATSSSSVAITAPASSHEKSSGNDGAATDAAAASSVFGTPTLATSTPPGGPTFGSLPAEKKPAAPTFTFGKPEEEKKEAPATSTPSAFLFGSASKDADPAPVISGGFSFGKPSVPAEQPQQPAPPALPPFTFGKADDKNDASNSKAANSSFVFGQSAPASDASKMPFFFMGSNASTTSSSSSTPSSSLFGSSTQALAPAPAATPSTFMFGLPAAAAAAPAASDAPPAKAFVFGQSQDTPSAAPVNSAPPQTAQPFIFGVAANPAAPPAPSINFGASAPSATSSPAPNPFLVSSSNAADFGANQTPAFGSSFSSPFPSAASQTPAFGAKPAAAAPVFGQQANSTPAFGGATANSAQGGGFQFGGASAFGSTNSTGVFNFGAGAAASPAPAASSGGGFNFSQPLSFNIGSSKSFTSSPAGQQTIAGRKIKTAVRRRK
ncbi:nuclear pore complex protein Nup153 [Hippocampus comes]|uniref:Nuclear pore complex protein Nup153 n=1 Tax=Hippocampus comes TaxID=109280 RepID=A0A3Q2YQJ3_HIPCM|nr:PREDICTED: nuclear pore complex protein Nup153 [Hippocampus comes]